MFNNTAQWFLLSKWSQAGSPVTVEMSPGELCLGEGGLILERLHGLHDVEVRHILAFRLQVFVLWCQNPGTNTKILQGQL